MRIKLAHRVKVRIAMISESAADSYISAWRKARSDRHVGELGYPTINILHPKHGVSDDDYTEDAAVEMVQRAVETMLPEIRRVFEAYYLGIIRNEFCGRYPHKWRWLVLGIDKARYYHRLEIGREVVRAHLSMDELVGAFA